MTGEGTERDRDENQKSARQRAADKAWGESHEGLRDRDQDAQIRENLDEAARQEETENG